MISKAEWVGTRGRFRHGFRADALGGTLEARISRLAFGQAGLVRLVAHKTSTVSSYETTVRKNSAEKVVYSSFSAMDLCGDLRDEMYQPGLGAWFIFTLEIAADGRITTQFNYDDEPVITSADAGSFVLEQKHFPRDWPWRPGR